MKQENNSSQLYKKADSKSLYATALILSTIAIVFFHTSAEYSKYIEKSEENASLNTKQVTLKAELDALNIIKKEYDSNQEMQKTISQFAGEFREDYILKQIYKPQEGIIVHDISLEKGSVLPNGLSLAGVSINVDAKTIGDLSRYTDYLTSDKEKIRFVIKSMNAPINTSNITGAISANISLGMYYYKK